MDVIELAPPKASKTVINLAAQGGPLHCKHRVYLERIAVAIVPENYEDRLSEMFAGTYQNLRIMALDAYDLALSKLGRNSQKDRDDVRFFAMAIPFDLHIFEQRYREEIPLAIGTART